MVSSEFSKVSANVPVRRNSLLQVDSTWYRRVGGKVMALWLTSKNLEWDRGSQAPQKRNVTQVKETFHGKSAVLQ